MHIRKHLLVSTVLTLSALITPGTAVAEDFNGHVNVQVKTLSAAAKAGQQVFNDNCSSCHGLNGAGTLQGPPLIHDIYNPGHHSNKAFYSAVRKGVSQHHWPYGNMPPQQQVGFSEMNALIKFIREVQQQNGIVARQHQM